MRPVVVTAGPIAGASANSIVTTVTPTLNQALTLVTSPFPLATPQRIVVTYGTEGTARTLTVTGKSLTGQTWFEVITIPVNSGGATIASVLDYASITSIVSGSAFTNAITVGTNQSGGSAWVSCDPWVPQPIAIVATVTGTVNYTVEQTLDDPNSPINPVRPDLVSWQNDPDLGAVGATTNYVGSYIFCPAFIRVVLNSGSGSVTMTVLQSGSVTF